MIGKSEIRSLGTAPAPSAVFRALAENIYGVRMCYRSQPVGSQGCWTRGRVQLRPGRACSPAVVSREQSAHSTRCLAQLHGANGRLHGSTERLHSSTERLHASQERFQMGTQPSSASVSTLRGGLGLSGAAAPAAIVRQPPRLPSVPRARRPQDYRRRGRRHHYRSTASGLISCPTLVSPPAPVRPSVRFWLDQIETSDFRISDSFRISDFGFRIS